MTKKLAIQHNEHQTNIKELLSFRDRQILEDKKVNKEEKKEKKKKSRQKKKA